MTGRLSPGNHSFTNLRNAGLVLLGLLTVAAAPAGRPTQPGAARRGPASRLQVIQLPAPSTSSAVSVEQALIGLRNLPAPGNQRLDLPKISQLAWAIQGSALTAGAAPVGAAPISTEVAAMKVYFVLPDGVYFYSPADHALQQLAEEDVRGALAASLLSQTGAPTGGCQVILGASIADFNKRYGSRGRTILALQAGRMSQNLQLEAVAQGLTFLSVDAVDAGAVRRVTRVLRALEPVYVAFLGYPEGQAPPATESGHVSQAAALLVVPPQGFAEEDLLIVQRALQQAGVQVMIASTRKGQLLGMRGGTVRSDLLLNEAKLDNFNAVVFIGGVGADAYLNNPVVLNLVRHANTQRKVLAAIGNAPSILASAGVLKGARATAYISEQARLVQGGALYSGNPVERDGLTVTATGPLAAQAFVQAIVDSLGGTTRSSTPPAK
jgi:protease I